MAWYSTGTVTLSQNSSAVTGTGTAFVTNARYGDAFLGPDGKWYEVINITSNTLLTISPAYSGTSVSNSVYKIVPIQGYVKSSADTLNRITLDLVDRLNIIDAIDLDELSYLDGATSNIQAQLDSLVSGGGGGSYTLPIASPSVLGGIKIGSGLSIDGAGVVSTTGNGSTWENADWSITDPASPAYIKNKPDTIGGGGGSISTAMPPVTPQDGVIHLTDATVPVYNVFLNQNVTSILLSANTTPATAFYQTIVFRQADAGGFTVTGWPEMMQWEDGRLPVMDTSLHGVMTVELLLCYGSPILGVS